MGEGSELKWRKKGMKRNGWRWRDGRLFYRKQGSGRPRTACSVESIRQAERSVWEERSVRAVACSPSGRSSRPSVPISSKSGSSRMAPLLIPLLHRVSGSSSASLAGSSAWRKRFSGRRTPQTWVRSTSSFGAISWGLSWGDFALAVPW